MAPILGIYGSHIRKMEAIFGMLFLIWVIRCDLAERNKFTSSGSFAGPGAKFITFFSILSANSFLKQNKMHLARSVLNDEIFCRFLCHSGVLNNLWPERDM